MGEANSTLILELVVVSMTLAVGAVVLADVWPSPDLPLIVMGALSGVFLIYAIAASMRDVQKMRRAQAEPQSPSDEQSGHTQQTSTVHSPATEHHRESPPEVSALTLGTPSESATEFLALDELRPETERDNTTHKMASVPLFAESSMYSTADLAAGARELAVQQEEVGVGADEPTRSVDASPTEDPSAAKTEALPSVRASAAEASEAKTEALPSVQASPAEASDEDEEMTDIIEDFDFDSIKLEDS